MAVNHPNFGTFCCICFAALTPHSCAVDIVGVKWDVCPGICARQAGIAERRQQPTGGESGPGDESGTG
jgi:hypothetical protein